MPVQLAVMDTTHRNSEFVADLPAERPRLGKAQMMGIGGRATAYHAWLAGHEFAMVVVAQPNGLGRHAATAGLCGIRISTTVAFYAVF